MKTDGILKFVSFVVLGLGEMETEDRIPYAENRKRHVDVTEEDLANGKQQNEGREFVNPTTLSLHFISLYFSFRFSKMIFLSPW